MNDKGLRPLPCTQLDDGWPCTQTPTRLFIYFMQRIFIKLCWYFLFFHC